VDLLDFCALRDCGEEVFYQTRWGFSSFSLWVIFAVRVLDTFVISGYDTIATQTQKLVLSLSLSLPREQRIESDMIPKFYNSLFV